MRRNQKPTQLKRKSETTCGCVVRNSQLLMSIVHSHTTFFLNRANLHKFCLLPKFWWKELECNFSTRKECDRFYGYGEHTTECIYVNSFNTTEGICIKPIINYTIRRLTSVEKHSNGFLFYLVRGYRLNVIYILAVQIFIIWVF